MKVLVADGSTRQREQIIGLLSGLSGVEIVGQAQDALEAVRAISALAPDVVTLDIQIIGGNGMDVLKKVKQAERAPVVIMLTHRTSLPYRKRCQAAGADFFLDKATEFERLHEIMQDLSTRFHLTGRCTSGC